MPTRNNTMTPNEHMPSSSWTADNTKKALPPTRPLTIIKAIIGECLQCAPMAPASSDDHQGLVPTTQQFLELQGIQFIGLGAVTDELAPKERVYDTLEQLTERTERLISIGYLVNDAKGGKNAESVPLDIWNQNFPNDGTMTRALKRTIRNIKTKQFEMVLQDFQQEYQNQKKRPLQNSNHYMLGITAHNLGVVNVLAKKEDEALSLFKEAILLKKDSFGDDHQEVAISLDELGVQYFAREQFEEALAAFNESKTILSSRFGSAKHHSRACMLLNNIACCNFQMGDVTSASRIMTEARELQRERNATSAAKADIDLLHLAMLLNNCGYLKAQEKQYEDAQASFEEALLIQQSVLGDAHTHRAIQDSRRNLDFVNAFHS